jgi:hypothetical protein
MAITKHAVMLKFTTGVSQQYNTIQYGNEQQSNSHDMDLVLDR